MSDKGIRDQVVLVLGGAGGIGSACARVLAARGAAIALADIDVDGMRVVTDSVDALGGRARSYVVDITQLDQVVAAVKSVVDDFGALDVMINCAGVMYIRPLVDLDVSEWATTIDLNLKGTMWGVAAALPTFVDQRSGHFISLGSVHGLKVSRGSAVHSASKFGVNAFMEGVRGELSEYDIRVSTVNPGAVDTGMQRKTTGSESERIEAIYLHAMSAETIADAIAFVIEQPAEVSVNNLVIRPTTQLI
ncbi:SDR family oxidoreductase [Mycolicibacterium sp. 018/SC-01/001]|uniref:SDR family oxidoreductase n=1 Tax=Mycolicibacterium sp. 018/SC-01/001 TaxID=2592069 RepID=UPI00117C2057|nr:SDR family oxidoreductase [Mycolicibacterium sp. 018/SC-01/001]TRW80297.1 SDR family oxidoreductase [Mycolicibacterium sp. 018/SC-01/001]